MPACKFCGKVFDPLKRSGNCKTVCSSCLANNNRSKRKLKAIEYKGGKCEQCGYNKCVRALTFHHRNPAKKTLTFGRGNWGWERLKKELEECDLLCMNCHMEIEDQITRSNSRRLVQR
jgi:hypothetical protein